MYRVPVCAAAALFIGDLAVAQENMAASLHLFGSPGCDHVPSC
jgi:hypothetical protein